MGENTAKFDEKDCAGLVRLLKIPRRLRKAEDVFEIANSLYRATFMQQLDVVTRCVVSTIRIPVHSVTHLSASTEWRFATADTFVYRTAPWCRLYDVKELDLLAATVS